MSLYYPYRQELPERPLYVPEHQVRKNLSTTGQEYMTEDGMEYIGLYHQYPNGARYTGGRLTTVSQRLLYFRRSMQVATRIDANGTGQPTYNNVIYHDLTRDYHHGPYEYHRYVTPSVFIPNPVLEDYLHGSIRRYFVQRKNDLSLIYEISDEAHQAVNSSNHTGIDEVMYNKLTIDWYINGLETDVRDTNIANLRRYNLQMPGLVNYLTDPLEFYRGQGGPSGEYQYTAGGELEYSDGRSYEGFYHSSGHEAADQAENARHSSVAHEILQRVTQ